MTAEHPPSRPVLPERHGTRLTDRDLEILTWVGRHGVVTPEQVARHFFTRGDGAVGRWAAYRRLKKLEEVGLLKRDRTFWREAQVLRLTGAAARMISNGIGPARLVLAEVRHALAVVDLLEDLCVARPTPIGITTERELRIERRRDLAGGGRQPGVGRIPDGVLHFPGDRNVAIELDLTPKRTADYERIVEAYVQERFSEIWWFVLPRVVPRVHNVVAGNQAHDLILVQAWEN